MQPRWIGARSDLAIEGTAQIAVKSPFKARSPVSLVAVRRIFRSLTTRARRPGGPRPPARNPSDAQVTQDDTDPHRFPARQAIEPMVGHDTIKDWGRRRTRCHATH